VQEYRGIWQVLNPSRAYCQVLAFDKLEASLDQIVGTARTVYVEQEVCIERVRVPWLLGLVSCVEVVKAAIGLRAPWIITPYQLWRWAHEEAESPRPHGRGTKPAARPA
jgi:hypothetical protein